MHVHRYLLLVLTLSMGCQGPVAPPTAPERQAASRRTKVEVAQRPGNAPGTSGTTAPTIVPDPTRQLGQSDLAQAVTLIGKVKLISDKGLGVISNNTGNLISDKGLGLISNNGGSYRLQATADEALLADATIEVLDAEGQVLQGANGQPLRATSDETGSYRFEAGLPQENLVLRVRLHGGGELLAMLALAQEPPSGPLAIDLDTASSLSAAYVLARYVKGSRQVYDKLPRAETEALAAAMEAARARLAAPPSYEREAQVAAAQALRGQVSQLDRKLEEIKLLLIGQENLGNGLKATDVPITTPIAVAGDDAGHLYVAESAAGRIRKIGPDGLISGFASDFNLIYDLERVGEALVVSDRFGFKIKRVGGDGAVTDLAGTGRMAEGVPGGEALTTDLGPLYGLGSGPTGPLYFTQSDEQIYSLGADGRIESFAAPTGWRHTKEVCVAADGTLAAMDNVKGQIALKPPGQGWRVVAQGLDLDARSRMLWEPAGTWLISETLAHRVLRVNADGTTEAVAGTGSAGAKGDGGPPASAELSYPAGLWRSSAGALYIADYGNGRVRVVENGKIRTVAGVNAADQQGDAQTLSLNGPWGLATDPQGRVVVSEGGSGTVKRLEGGSLTLIAGTSKGFSGDGGPATAAQLESTTGLAYAGDVLYVLCHQEPRIRRIGKDGLIATVGGEMEKGWLTAIATHPDGRVAVADGKRHVVQLLDEAEGLLLAGKPEDPGGDGDGGPATAARLHFPSGLVYGPDGALYVADSGNGRIRRIAADGTITAFAGLAREESIARAATYAPGQEEGAAALDAVLIGPGAMVFDQAGNMYLTEAGTLNLRFSGVGAAALEGLPSVGPRIRKITPDGKIYTVAGPGGKWFSTAADGLGAPLGLAIDGEGRLAVTDAIKNQLKLLPKGHY